MNLVRMLLTLVLVMGSHVPASAADPLAGLAGQKLVLLLFSKSRSDATLDRQLALLGDERPGLSDRKIVVLVVSGGRDPMVVIGYASLPGGAARQLTERFAPSAQGLTTVLIGLDGTELGRWQQPVEPQVIFDLVDSMPMRQQGTGAPATVN